MRTSVLIRYSNYKPNHTAHVLNFNENYLPDNPNYYYENVIYFFPESNDNFQHSDFHSEYHNFNTTENQAPYYSNERCELQSFQNFPLPANEKQPPDATNVMSKIQAQIQTTNLENFNVSVNFP